MNDACEKFFVLAVHAHIVAAAMQFLGMQTLDNVPVCDGLASNTWTMEDDERAAVLLKVSNQIVLQHFLFGCYLGHLYTTIQHRNDLVHAYAFEVFTFGLFYLNSCDAIREGDGD